MIFNGSLSIEGTPLTLSDEAIFSIIVLGTRFKEKRKELYNQWSIFGSLKYDPKVGEAAMLLSKGSPYCLCEEALIIIFDWADQASRCNLRENQRVLRQLAGQLIGHEVFVYGVDRNVAKRCLDIYYSRMQVGTLPSPDSIVLNLPK